MTDNVPTPPNAERRPSRIEQLGRTRTDDYAWLKDADWQKVMRDPTALRPDIRAHLESENAYTKAMLDQTQALQDAYGPMAVVFVTGDMTAAQDVVDAEVVVKPFTSADLSAACLRTLAAANAKADASVIEP